MSLDRQVNCCEKGSESLYEKGCVFLELGKFAEAESYFKKAIELRDDYIEAYLGLAKAVQPGPGYFEIIEKIGEYFKPVNFVEIGVDKGAVLKLFKPPIKVVGVDPLPEVDNLAENAALYKVTSDEFFATYNLKSLLGGACHVAFIDGLHLFEQVLRDFINLERNAAPDSIIMIHDCLPLDRRTAERERNTIFWSGDVWKIIPCLKQERPDLSIFTVPAYPAGLCFVTGLDCNSRYLKNFYDVIVERYCQLDYSDIKERETYFSMLVNDWPTIERTLSDNLAGVRL